MNYIQKENLGRCSNCGADNVRSPKTSKIFCGDKCWLNNPQAQNYNRPQRQYQPKPQRQEPDWDAVSERDFLHREWTAAKISAKDIIVILIQQGKLEIEKLRPAIKDLAEYLYGLRQPKEDIPKDYNEEGV